MLNRRFVTTALAAMPLGAAAEATPLRALVFDVRPYGFTDPAGATAGISVDWFKALAQEARLPITVGLSPLARVVRDFDQGQGDLILLIPSPIFAPTNVSRVIDVGTITLGVWTLNTLVATRVADLAGKKVVVLRGGSAEYLARGWTGVDVVAVNSVASMVSMLQMGRVDALLILEPTLKAHLDGQPDARFLERSHKAFESRLPMSLFVSRHVSEEMQQRIVQAVEVLKRARRFETLTEGYAAGRP